MNVECVRPHVGNIIATIAVNLTLLQACARAHTHTRREMLLTSLPILTVEVMQAQRSTVTSKSWRQDSNPGL